VEPLRMIFPRSLNARILIGAAVGIAIGLVVLDGGPAASFSAPVLYGAKILGTVFLDLLRMVLLPLVFSSIVVGVANLQAHHQMHRVWKLTLGFFVLSMAIAIIIGFGAAHLFRPGEGMQLSMFAETTASFQARQMPLADYLAQFAHGLFQNPFKALAQGDILAVVIVALFLGVALVVGGERYRNIRAVMQELQELCLMVVGWIMHLSPFGIGALLLQLVATQDGRLLGSLAQFIAVVIGSTLFHGVVVLPPVVTSPIRLASCVVGSACRRGVVGSLEARVTSRVRRCAFQRSRHPVLSPRASSFRPASRGAMP